MRSVTTLVTTLLRSRQQPLAPRLRLLHTLRPGAAPTMPATAGMEPTSLPVSTPPARAPANNPIRTPLLSLQRPSFSTVTDYNIKAHSESGAFEAITIKSECANYALLDSFFGFIERSADELGIERGGTVRLPTRRKVYTVLKSPHVYKQHRSQYELRTHKRCIQLRNVTEDTISAFVSYVTSNTPPGITTRISMRSLERLPESIRPAQEHQKASEN